MAVSLGPELLLAATTTIVAPDSGTVPARADRAEA